MPADLVPALSQQEGMIPHPKLRHPAEHCNQMSCDHIGCRSVFNVCLSRAGESNTSLLYWQTVDQSPGDLGYGPLEEGGEERVDHLVLHRMELHT